MGNQGHIKGNWLAHFNQVYAARKWLVLLGLILITFIVYHEVLHHDFVNFDDSKLIFQNKVVTESAQPVKDSFTWGLYDGHYKPMVFLSWWVEYKLVGETPWLFHLDNLLLHLCNVVLVFFLGRSLLPQFGLKKDKIIFGSALLAALFAVHPLHVESVAWAVERKDVLFSFFFLLGWLVYIRYISRPKPLLLVAVAVLYLLSMLSKSMGITLIAVLFLTDLLYQRKGLKRLVVEKIPAFLCFLTGAYLFGLLGGISDIGAELLPTVELGAPNVGGESEQLGLWNSVEIHATKLLLWLLHILFPARLSVVYLGASTMKAVGAFKYIAPFVLGGLVYGAYRLRAARPELLFGLLFFLITISPIIPVSTTGGIGVFLSDRYTYIPMLGILVILLGAALRLRAANLKHIALPIAGLAVLALSLMSFRAIKVWENSETLWTNALVKVGDNAAAYNGRGKYYLELEAYDKALSDFDAAIKANPRYALSHFNRCVLMIELGNFEEALASISNYLNIRTKEWQAFEKRAYIYDQLGQPEAALRDIGRALALKPNAASLYVTSADIYINTEQWDKAMENIKRSIELTPDYWLAYQKEALLYEYLNNMDAALASIDKAIALKKDEPLLLNNKSVILYKMGRTEEALQTIEQCLALDEGYEAGRATKSLILAGTGMAGSKKSEAQAKQEATVQNQYLQYKAKAEQMKKADRKAEAIGFYTECIKLSPDNFSNYVERGALYLNTGNNALAVEDFTEALRLNPDFHQALLFRSMAYNNLKQYADAVRDAESARSKGVQVDPAYMQKIEKDLAGG